MLKFLSDTIYNDLLIVSKGVWNNGTYRFDCTNSEVINAPVSHAGGIARYQGSNIAFSPNGSTWYIVMNGNDGGAFVPRLRFLSTCFLYK